MGEWKRLLLIRIGGGRVNFTGSEVLFFFFLNLAIKIPERYQSPHYLSDPFQGRTLPLNVTRVAPGACKPALLFSPT